MKSTLVKLSVFVLFSAACMGWLFTRIGQFSGPAGLFAHTYKVSAAFTDATGLVPGDEVRLAGVKIGKVGSAKVDKGKAIVGLTVDDRHRLPEGSRFELHWKNLLGQRFVEVVPPDGARVEGPKLAEGARVGSNRTSAAADITSLLNNTNPILARVDTASFNRMMATFAAALQGREDRLSQAIDQSAELISTLSARADVIGLSIRDWGTLLQGIAGHDTEVRRLLDSMASVSSTLAAKADDLGVAAGKAGEFTSVLSRVLAANDRDLDAVFGQTRQVLDRVVANRAVLDKAFRTVPWTTAAILRMTDHGDWIQSYTRGVGIIDANASEPRIGPNYNNVGPDDPHGGQTLLGQPRAPLPPVPSTDAGGVAVNPQPGAPKEGGGQPLTTLLDPLLGKKQ